MSQEIGGKFEGRVVTEWLEDGRNMKVLEPFAYVDVRGLRWEVAPEDIVNGASIPEFLWPIAGTPYIGPYRRPSVLHDVYCAKRTRSSAETHRMLKEAMLLDGADEATAWRFYHSILVFGSDWDSSGNVIRQIQHRQSAGPQNAKLQETFVQIADLIDQWRVALPPESVPAIRDGLTKGLELWMQKEQDGTVPKISDVLRRIGSFNLGIFS